jgi:hypothetical protein
LIAACGLKADVIHPADLRFRSGARFAGEAVVQNLGTLARALVTMVQNDFQPLRLWVRVCFSHVYPRTSSAVHGVVRKHIGIVRDAQYVRPFDGGESQLA